jgi:hypothetical protein
MVFICWVKTYYPEKKNIEALSDGILRQQKEVPWMVGMTELKASHTVPAVVFPSGLLLASPKLLLLVYHNTTNICVNRIYALLEREG